MNTGQSFGDVRAQVGADGVAVITLCRAERLNAVTPRNFAEIEQAVRWVGSAPGCRAVVLTGEGRSFCAGMDLNGSDPSYTEGGNDGLGRIERGVAMLRAGVDVILALREIRQPVVGAIRGHAVGAGFALSAACDLRVCSPDARFNAALVKLGVSGGDLGLSWFLPRLVGRALAAEVLYTGGVLDAEQARTSGLVSRVVDDPLLTACDLAAQIAAQPAFGVSSTKELLNASLDTGLRAHLDSEMRAQVLGLNTETFVRAVESFRARNNGAH